MIIEHDKKYLFVALKNRYGVRADTLFVLFTKLYTLLRR